MRTRARAASLCVAAFLVLAVLPQAASAQFPNPTMDNTVWPSLVNNGELPINADFVSQGACDPGDGTKTFTFATSGPGVLLGVDGTFAEQGSFAIARVDGILRVVDYDSTFTGSSTKGSVAGERHLRPTQIDSTMVDCRGDTAEQRRLNITIPRAHSEAEFTYPSSGLVSPEYGFARVMIGSFPGNGQRVSSFFMHYSSDQDRDEVRYIEDNCRTVYNPDQANADGDRLGDACDQDDDNDFRLDDADNCRYVPNSDQADADGDGIGDVCDPVHDVEDTDGDGVIDDADNCVDVPNEDQTDTGGTALGDACEDRDADGVGDLVDNCIDTANGDQANLDVDLLGDACDPDDDGDAVDDAGDNCPVLANPTQRDSDFDGSGDACDGAFDSTDGFVGGGGKLAGPVHFSIALHSGRGSLHGTGHLAQGATDVRLLDVTGLHSDGSRSVAVGHASIDGGAPVDYRLEIVDGPDSFDLEIGDRRWAGPLTNGNVVVK